MFSFLSHRFLGHLEVNKLRATKREHCWQWALNWGLHDFGSFGTNSCGGSPIMIQFLVAITKFAKHLLLMKQSQLSIALQNNATSSNATFDTRLAASKLE